MAIGLARMFGLRLPLNFDSPYRARSVIAYWQRWQMSLTRFFMATLHAPLTMAIMRRRRGHGLGTNRAAQTTARGFVAMIAIPLAVTMALAGIWHGAGATYLVFGLVHGVFLSVNHLWRLRRRRPAATGVAATIASVALTYVCVVLASVVFRAPSLSAAGEMLTGMAGWHGIGLGPLSPRTWFDLAWLGVLYAIVWAAPNSQRIVDGAAEWCWRMSRPWAVASGVGVALALLAAGGTAEFVYFQF